MPTTPSIPYRVRQTAATAGTGNITLTGVDATYHRTFASHYGTGTSVIGYVLVGPTSNKFFEIGINSFVGSTNILTRTDAGVLASSNAGLRVNIPAAVTYDVLALDAGSHYVRTFTTTLVMDQMDHGGCFVFTGTTGVNVTLASIARVPLGGSYIFKNDGTANLTLNPFAGDTIVNIAANYIISPGESLILYRGPTSWHAIPLKTMTTIQTVIDGATAAKQTLKIFKNATAPSTGMTVGDLWVKL